jgi:Legume lectin domain
MHHCLQLSFRRIASYCAMYGITMAVLALGAPAVRGGGINGFGNGVGWTGNTNGTGEPTFTTDTLTLTDGGLSEARSAFYNTAQSIGQFTAQFTYQPTQPGGEGLADGATFTLQTQGLSAMGSQGSALGVGGTVSPITPSAEFEINIFSNHTIGTNFVTNGATSNYNPTGAVNVASEDPIQVLLSYNGSVLSETLTDTNTNATFSASYTIDIASVLGGGSALVGFTGGTGAGSSVQVISNFTFQSSLIPEPSSLVLLGVACSAIGAIGFVRRFRTA